jgi:hypothetical protein
MPDVNSGALSGEAAAPVSTQAPDGARPTTVQEIQLAVGRDVPGFGGFWVDPEEPDRLKVWLTDRDSQLESTKASLSRLIGNYPALDLRKVDTLPGRYGFVELEAWHDLLLPVVASFPGWTSLDTQEKVNRLHVGVTDDETRDAIEKSLPELGIPTEAVEFRIEQLGEAESCDVPPDDLTDCRRPLLGGFQIQGETVGGTPLGPCTMGFLARRNGVQGLVTASHCTQYRFYVDSSEFHQPTIDNRIGVEVIDPPPAPYIGNCPGSYVCRWADAAWIQLDSTVEANQGWIARPDTYGETDWQNSGLFAVKWVIGPYIGMEVFKVGRTTGLTQGFMTQTNVDVPAVTPEYPFAILLDQHKATYYSDEGDSGAAVFTFTENQNNLLDIYLVGIHHHGADPGGNERTFSDVQYAQWGNDLGPLDVVVPPSGGGGR